LAKLESTGNICKDLGQTQAFSYTNNNSGKHYLIRFDCIKFLTFNFILKDGKVFSKRDDNFWATFYNLEPGSKYNVVLTTFFNGALIGELSVPSWTRPDPPTNLAS
jgi:hypothetical protein